MKKFGRIDIPADSAGRVRTVVALAAATLLGCAGYVPAYLDSEEPVVTTEFPVLANAGPDREVLRGFAARLDGRGTYHPQGRSYTIHWQQTAGEPVHLSNSAGIQPSFVAPLDEQTLTFELTADDGFWTTIDTVSVHVAAEPQRRAPRARAAADRRLEYGEREEPDASDIVSITDELTTTRWVHVNRALSDPSSAASGPRGPVVPELPAAIFRLEATRDGLSSSPDYLLLHRFDAARRGEQPPSASVLGPDVVAPGEQFVLDASGSGDANGDSLTVRWEILEGELGEQKSSAGQASDTVRNYTAPTRPQQVVVRVRATDGLLESSPADVSMVIAPETALPDLTVSPRLNRRAHPGNELVLDARAGADGAPPNVEYTWDQTAGAEQATQLRESGRLLTLTAPAEAGELAFAVRAAVEDTTPPIEGFPTVIRLRVLEPTDNESPRVFLCASTLSPKAGDPVTVVARISEPESDALGTPAWLVDDGASGTYDLTTAVGAPLTGVCSDPDEGSRNASTTFHTEVTTPVTPTTLVVRTTICDDLGACGTGEVTLETW